MLQTSFGLKFLKEEGALKLSHGIINNFLDFLEAYCLLSWMCFFFLNVLLYGY